VKDVRKNGSRSAYIFCGQTMLNLYKGETAILTREKTTKKGGSSQNDEHRDPAMKGLRGVNNPAEVRVIKKPGRKKKT